MLILAPNLKLPIDAVTQTFGILAKRRAGKSYLTRRLAEQLFGPGGQQIVIVDPKGDWWGIRSAANGKDPGLPVVILGGEKGDVRLERGSGSLVATLVAEDRVSLVLDLSEFRKSEIAVFMADFLENLYRLKARDLYRTPVMLIIDEADAIAPQRPQKGEERMLGAAEDIVRRGGQRGIGCTMVTQRAAVLNKNVLTQVQMLIALRTIAPQDLEAAKAWIDVHGTIEQRATLMETLPALPVGDAWFWSPGWPTDDGIFVRDHVLPIETFDSGATPKAGERRTIPKRLADVNLDALREKMAETIARAEAEDPHKLQTTVVRLTKERNELSRDNETLKALLIDERRANPAVRLINENQALKNLLRDAKHKASQIVELEIPDPDNVELNRIIKRMADTPQPVAVTSGDPRTFFLGDEATTHTTKAEARKERVTIALPIGEQKILTALIQAGRPIFRTSLTVLTGYKKSSRDAYIQRLREKGYVETEAMTMVSATQAGIAALPRVEPLPRGNALRDWHLQRIPEGEAAILKFVMANYPNAIERTKISDEMIYKKSSRDAYLQRLVARDLVTRHGSKVRASEDLFD